MHAIPVSTPGMNMSDGWKRWWWNTFIGWLKKLNNVEVSNKLS